jgi:signal transduction histidine kinase
MLLTRLAIPSTMAWIGTWMWTLNVLVFALGLTGLVALVRVRQRTVAGRWLPSILVAPLLLCALFFGFGLIAAAFGVAISLVVFGGGSSGVVHRRWRPAIGAVLALIAGFAVTWLALVAPEQGRLALEWVPEVSSILPPSTLLLGVAVLRYRVYDIDVLRDSRRRAITTREEERRRVRRDLHDGLGPMLASMTLNLDLARQQVRSDPEASVATIDRVKGDTQRAVTEVRRVVRDLRPSALDDLGLVEALRVRIGDLAIAARQTGPGTAIEFIPGELPALDAATEVAAYLIVLEAVTNVIRHAHATRCLVRLTASDGLDIEVTDDGVGIDPTTAGGIGLTAMRERAVELGGTWQVGRSAVGWTRIAAHLPIQP